MIRTYVGQPPVKVMGDTVAVPPGTVMRFGVHKTLWRVSHHPLVLLVDPAAADRAATVQTAAALGAHVAAAHDAAGGAPCTHVLVPATGEVVTDSAVLTSVITGRPTVTVPCQCWLLHIRVCIRLGLRGAERRAGGRAGNVAPCQQIIKSSKR